MSTPAVGGVPRARLLRLRSSSRAHAERPCASIQPCAASSASLRPDAGYLRAPVVPRVYPMVAREYPIVPREYPIIAPEYPIVPREYPIELLSSTPCGASAGRARTGGTGAQQLRAAFAGADRIGVEVAPTIVALVKVAAAWVGRIRLTAEVGLAGCRGRTLARRRVDDREIACRALIASILAPRIAGCTKPRPGCALTCKATLFAGVKYPPGETRATLSFALPSAGQSARTHVGRAGG